MYLDRTLGGITCHILLTLLAFSEERELGVRISFSRLGVVASSGEVTFEVHSFVSVPLLGESSNTAVASRGLVSEKNQASRVQWKKMVKFASGWLTLSQEMYLVSCRLSKKELLFRSCERYCSFCTLIAHLLMIMALEDVSFLLELSGFLLGITLGLYGYIPLTLNPLIMVSGELDFSHALENTSLNLVITLPEFF